MNSLTEFSKPLFWKVMKRNRSFDTGTDHTHQQPPFITGLQIFIIQSILEYYGTYPLLHSNRGSALSNCKDLHPNYISITLLQKDVFCVYSPRIQINGNTMSSGDHEFYETTWGSPILEDGSHKLQVQNQMTSPLDPNSSHTIFILSLCFQWYMFFGKAANKATYETHKERLSVLALWLLAVALSLGARVVSTKRTCDIIPVLKAHPVECMAAKYSQSEIINTILSHLCHLILLSW